MFVTCPECGNKRAKCPIGFFIECPNSTCKNYHRQDELKKIEKKPTIIKKFNNEDYQVIDLELDDIDISWETDELKTLPYGWIQGDGFMVKDDNEDDNG